MKKKLRLLVTQDCPRSCEGCCNKGFDLEKLPVVSHFDYDLVMITGGEPLSDKSYHKTRALLNYLKWVDVDENRKVVVYTASRNYYAMHLLLKFNYVDGITVTLHTQEDAYLFCSNYYVLNFKNFNKSLRLNVFNGIKLPEMDSNGWEVKKDIEWIKDCPLPNDEIFMRTKTI